MKSSSYSLLLLLVAVLLFPLNARAEESVTFALFNRTWPPFEMFVNGGPAGTSIDLFNALMPDGMTRKVETFPGPRSSLHAQTGPVYTRLECKDWMSNPEDFFWSDTVLDLKSILISPLAKPVDFNKPEDLHGLTIGCIKNYYYPALDPLFKSQKAVRYDVNSDAVLARMAKAGRVDAAVFDETSVNWIVYNMKDVKMSDFHVAKKPLSHNELRFVFNKNPNWAKWLPKINERIRKKREDGTIDKIRSWYQE